ncbi:MAG: glycosyltransferase family 2 protein [Cyanobacteriota bacterium]|jgi:cellulose synthase/poly-beta-1,6-N-acetylglucosamine synthase-like glycosyltransferase
MVWLLDLLLTALALVWLLPALVLLGECLSAVFAPLSLTALRGTSESLDYRVLVPAHDEGTVIGQTLDSLLLQIARPENILVVADNCADDTAAIARSYGVTVIERRDPERRGKGYALDFGVRFLESQPPQTVIILDADCLVGPGALAALAADAWEKQRPIQSLYLLEKPSQATPKTLISALAFLIKNQVRPTGLAVWGLPCLLTGSGMAFPWRILQQAPLASGNLVEDIQLGLDLALAGYPPQFCPRARVTGVLPQGEETAVNQRRRWEHGYLETLLKGVPRLLGAGLTQGNLELLALAGELSIVPLSLWVLLWLGGLALSVGAWLLGVSVLPLLLLLLSGLAFAVAVLGAWYGYGRSEIPLGLLLKTPLYILWKIPLYFAFIVNRQSQWVRTDRESGSITPPRL